MQAYQKQKPFLHDGMSSLVQQDPWLCLLDPPDFLEFNFYLCIMFHVVLFTVNELTANVWIQARVHTQ